MILNLFNKFPKNKMDHFFTKNLTLINNINKNKIETILKLFKIILLIGKIIIVLLEIYLEQMSIIKIIAILII